MSRVLLAICTAGRPQRLDRLLERLRSLEGIVTARDLVEVLVVDNRPGGSAHSVAALHRARLPMALDIVAEPRIGIPFARNHAVAVAQRRRADFLAFVDDDDLPRPDWLARLLDRQRASGADIVLGVWERPAGYRVPRVLARVALYGPLRMMTSDRYHLPTWGGTYNILIGAAVLATLAGEGPVFAEAFGRAGGEDTDFMIRAAKAGFSITVASDSVVVRDWDGQRLTLGGAMRRGFRMGSSQMQLAKAHLPSSACRAIRRKAWRQLVETLGELPLRLGRPERLGVLVVRLATKLGEIACDLGWRYTYYR